MQSNEKRHKNHGKAKYRSPAFDSGGDGTVWHRIKLNMETDAETVARVSVYASDNKNDAFSGKRLVGVYENPSDILARGAKGRYLWFSVEFSGAGNAVLNSVEVSFPSETLLDYLPEIYGKNAFADRWLSIFQTLYDDFEEEIRHGAALYEIETAPDDFITRMAGWLDVPDISLWGGKLRKFLGKAAVYSRVKGTFEGLRLITSLFCGVEPVFVETRHAMRYYSGGNGETLKRLYSSDRFSFWTIIPEKISEQDEKGLRRLLERNIPVNTRVRLTVLNSALILNFRVYLGMNSVVSRYGRARLNGECLMNYCCF
ncbi:MAG: hypothetical protein LBI38_02800 [Oscillospiraceae bacterium]|jgi:phage tail-like protein|nr:hypothetical protein [Oscillospiraceae bacterium]